MKPTPPAGKKFMGRKPPWKEVTTGEAVVKGRPARGKESLYGCLDVRLWRQREGQSGRTEGMLMALLGKGGRPREKRKSEYPRQISPFNARVVELCSEKEKRRKIKS